MCCKCCQNILESLWWHCFEKRWCYDEEIALYSEPEMISEEKFEKVNEFAFDNMAFYDSVAVIAGRAIVTIQPLSKDLITRKTSDTKSPNNVHWNDESSKENNSRPKKDLKPANVLPIIKESKVQDASSTDSSKKSAETDDATKDKDPELLKIENAQNKSRRPSLQQRRMSKILTLRLDANSELPIIRQNSMPKFYLDTPEPNQNDSSILRTPSLALTSPVVPHKSEFDLRSIVQHETQSRLQHTVSQASRIAQIKDKFKKPLLVRRQLSSSMSSIPNIVNHM